MTGDVTLAARLVDPRILPSEDAALWEKWLAEDPRLHSAFFSPAFARAAASAYPGVLVAVLEDASGPAAFFPFQRLPGLAGRLGGMCRVGEEMSDYFGLVARSGFRIDPARLLSLCRIAHLYFTHLDETQTSFGLIGEQPETGLRIDLSDGSARYLETLRKTDGKLMSDTDRRARKLEERYGPIRFQIQSGDMVRDLGQLVAAKRAQYRRTGAGDLFEQPERLRLLEGLAHAREASCTAVLSTLHAGETWAASHFGLLCHGVLHYWFPAYNVDLRSFSPGRLLIQHIVGEAATLGIQAIDRGAGESAAKRDFANAAHTYLRGVWHDRTLSALALRIMTASSWRLAILRAGLRKLDR
jgi:CelD/BcsL family acetyltransferase involved in cellulose biosynthesis